MNQFIFQFNITETKGKPLNDHMPEKRYSRNLQKPIIKKDLEAAEALKENDC